MNDSKATQTALSTAWGWSKTHSPILYICRRLRYMGRPNHEAFKYIEAAGLAGSVEKIIKTAVHRSKLWASERYEIARELVTHVLDASEAGKTAEEVVESFGDPERVAKLLRRSMKRKRPMYWKAYRNTKRATGLLICLTVLGWGTLAAQYYLAKPQIRKNFAAEITEKNIQYAEDQKSWMVLMDVGVDWEQQSWLLNKTLRDVEAASGIAKVDPAYEMFPVIDQTHPEYELFADLVRSFSPQLDRLREAAGRDLIGLPTCYKVDTFEWQGKQWNKGVIPATEEDHIEKPLIAVLLPHLGGSRRLAQVLLFDSQLAIKEGDHERYVENIVAIMGIARQHKDEPYLISNLVGVAIYQLAYDELLKWLVESPETFTEDQLVALAHTNAILTHQDSFAMTGERMSFEDLLQRVYTDDGNGNGHLTSQSLGSLARYGFTPRDVHQASTGVQLLHDESILKIIQPLSVIRSMDRKSESALYKSQLDLIEQVIQKGPEYFGNFTNQRVKSMENHNGWDPTQFSLTEYMLPALGHTVNKYYEHKQHCLALGTMIAIELFDRSEGRLPASLSELTPHLLPTLPRDYMNPGQSLMYIPAVDGYVLYSVGSDGDDDHRTLVDEIDESDDPTLVKLFSLRFQARLDHEYQPPIDQVGRGGWLAEENPDGDWILIDTRTPKPDPSEG